MISGQNNIINIGNNVELISDIVGDNNEIVIKDALKKSNIKLYLRYFNFSIL